MTGASAQCACFFCLCKWDSLDHSGNGPILQYAGYPSDSSTLWMLLRCCNDTLWAFTSVSLVFLNALIPSASKWLSPVVGKITVTLLFLNFMLPNSVGPFDGFTHLSNMAVLSIDVLKFVLILLGMLYLFFKNPKKGAEFLEIVWGVSLGWSVYALHISTHDTHAKNQSLEPLYALSSQQNILVIGMDSIQGAFLEALQALFESI